MNADIPEREFFFLHWEASMTLELATHLIAADPSLKVILPQELIAIGIRGKFGHRDDPERDKTVQALAWEHYKNAVVCWGSDPEVMRPHATTWGTAIAVFGSAATEAARTAAQCMETAWLDAAESDWQDDTLIGLDHDVADLVKQMKDKQ